MLLNKRPDSAHKKTTTNPPTNQSRVQQAQNQEQHTHAQLGHESHAAGHINPNELRTLPHAPHDAPAIAGVTIYLDRHPYHLLSTHFSGADIRALSTPPIGHDRCVFRVVSGKGDDIQISDADLLSVSMRDPNQGRHFFSDTIIPSKDAVARAAYNIYVEDGCQDGHDKENWAKAEAQIDTRSKS